MNGQLRIPLRKKVIAVALALAFPLAVFADDETAREEMPPRTAACESTTASAARLTLKLLGDLLHLTEHLRQSRAHLRWRRRNSDAAAL